MTAVLKKICVIGFGEAGGIFAADLRGQHCEVNVFDILIRIPAGRERMVAKAAAARVKLCATPAEALADAELVISAVTATAAEDVARDCEKLLRPGQVFLDINSISPDAKCENARAVELSGAAYIEAAVMAPVPPLRLKVPMLLGGQEAQRLAEQLCALGMNARAVSDRIGVASAIKMCRSVMIKGLEALAVESMFAARRYGAEEAVLASLHASFPSLGWNAELPNYLISRVAEHGRRRAAEMREVARTVQDSGLPPLMASAIAQRHDALIDSMEAVGLVYDPAQYDSSRKFSWRELADALASNTTK